MSEALTHIEPMKHELAKHIADVLISSPADGQVLTYESASQKWKNKTPAGGAGATVDTYQVDTASSWAVNSISWIDDPTCVVTIPATGKATKVVIFYSGRGMSSTLYTAIAIRISVAGSGVVNTYRDQYVSVANTLMSMATQHVYSWNGASALTVKGQASGNPLTMWHRGLSLIVIY